MSRFRSFIRYIVVGMFVIGVAQADDAESGAKSGTSGWFSSSRKDIPSNPGTATDSIPATAIRNLDKIDVERERLAELLQELVYLRRQVADAAKLAPGATRVQFRYDWLDRDLELIQRGIQDHFDAPRQPRPAPALKGSYRR